MAESITADFRTEVTIPLKFPQDVEGVHYSEITIRRPKGKDQLFADRQQGTQAEKGLRLFARLCNVDPGVIEELDQYDLDAINMQFERFTART